MLYNATRVPQRTAMEEDRSAASTSGSQGDSGGNKARKPPKRPAEQSPSEHARSMPASHARRADLGSAPDEPDPNKSFEVDRILSHRRFGRQLLYRVRWAPPYEGQEHDLELAERAFDRIPGEKLPPVLCDYWRSFPVQDRPAAYRKLGDDGPREEAPAEGCPAKKRRRSRKRPAAAPESAAGPLQNRARRRGKKS